MMSPPRSPSRSRAPRLRVVAALAVLASASACAAVLGIGGDFREGEGVSAGTDGGDAFSDARACDAADPSCLGDASDPSKVCDPSSCAAAGGTCTRGSCLLACVGGCADKVFTCPPGADCTIGCTDQGSCSAARCQGGRSCTFECSGNASCKQGISCESERCEFRCTAESDSCKDGPPLSCDASVCIADCAGKNACNRGVNANASAYCGITCSGTPSCNSPGAPILCISPDASIVCTNARDTCKDGKPSCYAQNCSIECLGPTSCSAGLCCDAGTCALDSSAAKANVCP